VTGGIAAYKAALVARLLDETGAIVSVVLTENATRFIGADTFAALTREPVHSSLWSGRARCCTSGSRARRTSRSSCRPRRT
jgi:phosphopantothenoylcysteine synthetase/decarboxylase